jgi:uncharacterized cupin superfamily protein
MDPAVTSLQLDPDAVDPANRFQRVRNELGLETFGLNLMVLQPGQRSRIHRHKRQDEVYVVLAGTLTLSVEGEERELAARSVVKVPAATRRQLINRHPERLELLAMGAHGDHQGRDGEAFASWDDAEPRSPADMPYPDDVEVG